jgi:hypothetical protein
LEAGVRELRAFFVVVVALLLLTQSAAAAAPTKQQCIAASEKADSQRTSGSLRGARASYLTCASVSCPKLVRDDCNKNMAEIEAATPTLTFTAKNGVEDISAVTIAMDGEVVAQQADGKPISVDPGEHTFTFTHPGAPEQTQKLVLREGEKNRAVLIQFGDAPKADKGGRLIVTSSAGAAITVDGKTTTVGRFDGALSPGSHEVRVSENGKVPTTRIVEVKSDATETVNVELEPEKKSILPWVVGGAAIVTAGLVVGGILLFGSKDKTTPAPQGTLGGIGLASFR